jgi:KDO2-lipid IV(A) lauroyltransferase
MSRKSPFTIQAEYLPLRGLLFLLQLAPSAWSRAFCRVLLRGVMTLIPKRRRLMESQLKACFPTLTSADIQALAERSLDTLADSVAMFARIATLNRDTMSDWVTIEGFEHIEEAFKKGRGMITFTAHMGCWELMAVRVTWLYPLIAMVVRPLDNPKLDAMVTRIRGSGGGGVIDSHKVFKEGLRLLRSNGILGVLIDQNFYKGGVFVNFFGRPAATNTLVPILARRTGCAVLPMHNVWRNGKIHIICEPPVALSENPDASQAIQEDTQTLTSYVERWIREDPAQWMWIHNRWKRQPQPGELV